MLRASDAETMVANLQSVDGLREDIVRMGGEGQRSAVLVGTRMRRGICDEGGDGEEETNATMVYSKCGQASSPLTPNYVRRRPY